MKTINLTCNHCGAPLDVPDGTNFVTCRFCSTRLAVEHSESTIYTRVLEVIENHASEVSENLDTIKLQNELERLDREWEMERSRLLLHGKNGELREPDARAAGCAAAFQILIGLAWSFLTISMAMATGMALIGLISLFGFAIAIYGIIRCQAQINLAEHFRTAKAEYESRRETLTYELDRRAAKF